MKGRKPNFSHICVLGARAWVHIPKKRKKLDKCSWQGIHVGYEDTNQYRIYNPCTEKIHVIRDVTIDKKNLFDRKAFQPKELVDDEWSQGDDNLFGTLNDDNSNAAPNSSLIVPTLNTPITLISDQKGKHTQQNQSKGGYTLIDDNLSKSDSIPLRKSA